MYNRPMLFALAFQIACSGDKEPKKTESPANTSSESSSGGSTKEKSTKQDDSIPKKETGSAETITSKLGFKAKLIPAGKFMMGSKESDEYHYFTEKLHSVTLTRPFYMMESEITLALYKKMEMNTFRSECQEKTCPVENITWYDMVALANAISKAEGLEECYTFKGEKVFWPKGYDCKGWRLPTEAEWEYAAKGGESFKYAGSDDLKEIAWYSESKHKLEKVHPVCQKKQNAYGLCDMTGNVAEWVWDYFDAKVRPPATDPTGPEKASKSKYSSTYDRPERVKKGCNSFCSGPYPGERYNRLRNANRGRGKEGDKDGGGRLVRSLEASSVVAQAKNEAVTKPQATAGSTGEFPSKNSFVTIKYSIVDAAGQELYKTKEKGTMRVIKREPLAIQKAIMGLKTGDRKRFTLREEEYKGFHIPGKKIELNGVLTFDIELLKIKEMPKPKPRGVKQIPAPSDVASPPADAITTASGLAYKSLQPGSGTERPSKNGSVTVHYTGWQTDGTTFDSSITRGKPATFGVGQVIEGWTEGLQLMTKGQKMRFWIPESLAYMGKREPKGMLVFDVELLEITKPPTTPSLRAPKRAFKTKSGLKYDILKMNPRGTKIKSDSMVMAHLSVWDTNGELKQSSKLRGQPQRLMLSQPNLPALLKESVLLLTEGSQGRFWLPGDSKARGFAKEGLILELEIISVKKAPKRPLGK